MPQILLSKEPTNGVRLLTLNRPAALNALNTVLLETLIVAVNGFCLDAFLNKRKPPFSGR